MQYFLGGCAFWGVLGFIVYETRPNAMLSEKALAKANRDDKVIISVVVIAVVLLCILPMSLSPHWNGDPGYTSFFRVDQYEIMTESILDGRIDLDYGDMDPRLLELENPYDPQARDDAGVYYHWDHAFYNGKYYMYFGVVPVFLVFLPFRLLFGTNLTTYHATQIFTTVLILGMFRLFYMLSEKYMRRMTLSVYLTLTSAMAIMSSWYFAWTPALYCTAISAGVCLQLWSAVFYLNALWSSDGIRKSVRSAVIGSVLGSLAFGCRPTVALVNFLLTPMFMYCAVKRRSYRGFQVLWVLLPFAVTGGLLMWYNYVRFDSPFEFGQTYQLTVADQSQYGNPFSDFSWIKLINGVTGNVFWYAPLEESFPYLREQSLFRNFPICVIAVICLLQKDTLRAMRQDKLLLPVGLLAACVVIITAVQVLQAPYLMERYRCDVYWIVGILVFLSCGIFQGSFSAKSARTFGFILSILALCTIFRCFLLWTTPGDFSFTANYPEYLDKFSKVLSFGA